MSLLHSESTLNTVGTRVRGSIYIRRTRLKNIIKGHPGASSKVFFILHSIYVMSKFFF